MKTKVFVDNPNPLMFIDSFSKFLEIIEMSLKYGSVSETISNCITLFSMATLTSLQSPHYFFSEVADNDFKFRDLIYSLLSLIEITSSSKLLNSFSKLTLGKIMQMNAEGIIQRINSPPISEALEAVVKMFNDHILTNTHHFLNGDHSDLEPTKTDSKILIRMSEIYAENFRGHKFYLETLLKLLEIQYDTEVQEELKEDVYQHVIVAYMVALKWLFKSSRFHKVFEIPIIFFLVLTGFLIRRYFQKI